MSRYLLFPIFMIAVFMVLVFTNPFFLELQIQRFSRGHWIYVYCEMTVVVSLIAFVIVPAVMKPLQRRNTLAASIAGALVTIMILGSYAYLAGTILGAGQAAALPLHDLNHFFRNFRSVVFIFIEAPIFGVMTGLFQVLWGKLRAYAYSNM
jgi:hypothetical protein